MHSRLNMVHRLRYIQFLVTAMIHLRYRFRQKIIQNLHFPQPNKTEHITKFVFETTLYDTTQESFVMCPTREDQSVGGGHPIFTRLTRPLAVGLSPVGGGWGREKYCRQKSPEITRSPPITCGWRPPPAGENPTRGCSPD